MTACNFDDASNVPCVFPTPYFLDADGDGLGHPESPHLDPCSFEVAPAGYVTNADDCDDADANLGSMTTWYEDADQDDLGDPAVTVVACFQPVGYVSNSDDFCPVDPANPDADGDQICDSEDNCFDTTACNYDDSNNGICVYTITYYLDADGDGLGDASNPLDACWTPSSNYVLDSSDNCDDPSACNYADGTNSNCIPATIWYLDQDGDGVGDLSQSVQTCEPGANYVETGGDNCEDLSACNYDFTQYEENLPCEYSTTWFLDQDGDFLGDPNNSVVQCFQPAGYVANDSDQCPTDSAKEAPGICGCGQVDIDEDGDGICDEDSADADSSIDDNCTDVTACNYDALANEVCDYGFIGYLDEDGDGIGSVSIGVICETTASLVSVGGDNCDNPAACNWDSQLNDECTFFITWYTDSDGDGLGELGLPTLESCEAIQGYVDNALDECFDPASCNYADEENNECDYGTTWYLDADADGYGIGNTDSIACDQPIGYVSNALDCDDAFASSALATAWYAVQDDGSVEIVYSCDSVAGLTSCISAELVSELLPISIEWSASNMSDSISVYLPSCDGETVFANGEPITAYWENVAAPFGAPTKIEINSPEGDGFWNQSDLGYSASSASITDTQKAPEYVHFRQLVDKTVNTSGNYVVWNPDRNQTASLYDTWRWSGLHNADPRWAIPRSVTISHKIYSASTHSGVDAVRALTHSSTANAYGNGSYNNPAAMEWFNCTNCGTLTGTNSLHGDHWSAPEENAQWFSSNLNYALNESNGWYQTPSTGSFNSIMNHFGHPTVGVGVTGVTTQTVFLPAASGDYNGFNALNGNWFLQVKQQSWTNEYSFSGSVTEEVCGSFSTTYGPFPMCSADGLDPSDPDLWASWAWNPALTVHPGGHRNGMYASTRIGFNMYSNESGASGWSGNGQWSWSTVKERSDNNQSWATNHYLSSTVRNTLTNSVRYLGNNFIKSQVRSMAGGAQDNFANRSRCMIDGGNLNCGINTITSYHRAKGDIVITPAKGSRRFAFAYRDNTPVGHNQSYWPPDVWVTHDSNPGNNAPEVVASIEGDLCEDVRLGLSVELVNELSDQSLKLELRHWAPSSPTGWNTIKTYSFNSTSGVQTIDDDVCASTYGGPSGLYPIDFDAAYSNLFWLTVTDESSDGQTYMNDWSLKFEEMSSTISGLEFPSLPDAFNPSGVYDVWAEVSLSNDHDLNDVVLQWSDGGDSYSSSMTYDEVTERWVPQNAENFSSIDWIEDQALGQFITNMKRFPAGRQENGLCILRCRVQRCSKMDCAMSHSVRGKKFSLLLIAFAPICRVLKTAN